MADAELHIKGSKEAFIEGLVNPELREHLLREEQAKLKSAYQRALNLEAVNRLEKASNFYENMQPVERPQINKSQPAAFWSNQ